MSAVSKSVIPRSSAFATTARAPARSTRFPKLLQPRPTAEMRRPERPRFRSSTPRSVPRAAEAVTSHLVERGSNYGDRREDVRDVGVVEGDLPGREDGVVHVLLLHRRDRDAGVLHLARREPDLAGCGGGGLSVHRALSVAPGSD